MINTNTSIIIILLKLTTYLFISFVINLLQNRPSSAKREDCTNIPNEAIIAKRPFFISFNDKSLKVASLRPI